MWLGWEIGITVKVGTDSCTGSGQLSEGELRTALVNGDWSSFDPHTVRMMIRY